MPNKLAAKSVSSYKDKLSGATTTTAITTKTTTAINNAYNKSNNNNTSYNRQCQIILLPARNFNYYELWKLDIHFGRDGIKIQRVEQKLIYSKSRKTGKRKHPENKNKSSNANNFFILKWTFAITCASCVCVCVCTCVRLCVCVCQSHVRESKALCSQPIQSNAQK